MAYSKLSSGTSHKKSLPPCSRRPSSIQNDLIGADAFDLRQILVGLSCITVHFGFTWLTIVQPIPLVLICQDVNLHSEACGPQVIHICMA